MRTHLWKPLLHEVAAGTRSLHEQALDYLQQARQHHFRFPFIGASLKGSCGIAARSGSRR